MVHPSSFKSPASIRTGETVAGKFLPGTPDAEGSEVYCASKALSSEFCARLLDVYSHNSPALVGTLLLFELADGSLSDFLNECGRAPVATSRFVSTSVAHALRHLLSHGICHGDVKAANVFLHGGRDWQSLRRAVLGDFGSCFPSDTGCRNQRERVDIGTPRWQAPELLHAPPVYSPAVDAYGLGLVLLSLAAGDINGLSLFDSTATGANHSELRAMISAHVGAAACAAMQGRVARAFV